MITIIAKAIVSVGTLSLLFVAWLGIYLGATYNIGFLVLTILAALIGLGWHVQRYHLPQEPKNTVQTAQIWWYE